MKTCMECGGPFPAMKPSALAPKIYCGMACYIAARERAAIARLQDNIHVTDAGCWEFTGHRTENGYGKIQFKRKAWAAHRLTWTLFFGEIPDGMVICHKCDNKPCINPDHLFLGTLSDNMADMVRKGRGRIGETTRQVVGIPCNKGHSGDERVRDTKSRIHCRVCHRENVRRWKSRRKDAR